MNTSKMGLTGEEISIIVDDVQWSPESAYLFRKTSPSVYPGFFDQEEARTMLERMPIFQGVVARVNQVLERVARTRETVERELRR